eukprot:1073056-Prymnesium_polylepis.2
MGALSARRSARSRERSRRCGALGALDGPGSMPLSQGSPPPACPLDERGMSEIDGLDLALKHRRTSGVIRERHRCTSSTAQCGEGTSGEGRRLESHSTGLPLEASQGSA